MERVISDECLDAIRRRCYEAGRAGREVYTVRDADGPEVVRCRECVFSEGDGDLCVFFADGWNKHTANVDPDGFCAWGIRRDE